MNMQENPFLKFMSEKRLIRVKYIEVPPEGAPEPNPSLVERLAQATDLYAQGEVEAAIETFDPALLDKYRSQTQPSA